MRTFGKPIFIFIMPLCTLSLILPTISAPKILTLFFPSFISSYLLDCFPPRTAHFLGSSCRFWVCLVIVITMVTINCRLPTPTKNLLRSLMTSGLNSESPRDITPATNCSSCNKHVAMVFQPCLGQREVQSHAPAKSLLAGGSVACRNAQPGEASLATNASALGRKGRKAASSLPVRLS